MSRARKIRIFLSGTDQVADIMSQLNKSLKRMGFVPLWFRSSNFPQLCNNAMDNCIEVAKICDRMVLILDERSGLDYKPRNVAISEAEFDIAHERDIPCLVFVRARIWHQSRVFHRHLRETGGLTREQFSSLLLDGDRETYEFIERLQHKTRGSVAAVPWITPFEFADDIIECIRNKWLLPIDKQIKFLSSIDKQLRLRSSQKGKQEVPGSGTGRVRLHTSFIRKLASLPEEKQARIRTHLLSLRDQLFTGAENPLNLQPLVGPNLQGLFQFQLDEHTISLDWNEVTNTASVLDLL